MLFILTGDVQIGKTRWLEQTIAELAEAGIPSYGVIAPGQWVKSTTEHADANGYEKLGIDNVLLPVGERITFALREDIAREQGAFDPNCESGQAQLIWHISDEAIDCVNDHFRCAAKNCPAVPSLLVIDELGRLELLRNGGLTDAMELLAEGPSSRFPHSLIIVRDYLLDQAMERFAPIWGEVKCIGPTEESRQQVLQAFQIED